MARLVDWGFPEPILQFAFHGEQGKALLLEFPPPKSAQKFGTIEGNISTALAMAGDEKQFAVIADEAGSGDLLDARKKLEFIGERRSVDVIFRDISKILSAMQTELAKKNACVAAAGSRHWNTETLKSSSIAEECEQPYQEASRLWQSRARADFDWVSRMLQHFPFQPSSQLTPAEIQIWVDWWTKNKDTAQFRIASPKIHE